MPAWGGVSIVLSLLMPCACGGLGVRPADRPTIDGGSGVCATKWLGIVGGGPPQCEAVDGGVHLCGAPLPFDPTGDGFGLNAVVSSGDPTLLNARVRPAGTKAWGGALAPTVRAADTAAWRIGGLAPGTRYEYEIQSPENPAHPPLYGGSVVTQRQPGQPFTFALISDTHIGPAASYQNQGDWCTLAAVAAQVGTAAPDFLVNLGDMLDFHQYGFNEAPPDSSLTGIAYRNYRALLGDTLGHAAHYAVIGNWEGENGYAAAETIAQARTQRMLYVPGPTPSTYPESGSPYEDYYAFTWGDALFIVLNVVTYTTTAHLLSYDPGQPDDWTLGEAQLAWLADTLARATSKWKLLLIHHAVGGAAGDAIDSAYGRGGGQAAYVGEQATVHQLMLQYGAQIFFYGHDHVFTDMQVDGIHYTEPGSAGAIWMFGASETGYQQAWLRSGWGQVAVGPSALEVRFRALDGSVFYTYALE
jgi:3',5'-cyclic AMP phosphodiesterase CpdA